MKFVIAVIAITMLLCISAFGQTTASEWLDKGIALAKQVRYDEALIAFDKVIQLDPNLAEVWYNKGRVLKSRAKFDEASQAYNNAIALNPSYAEAWNAKGWLIKLHDVGNFSDDNTRLTDAIKCFDTALKLDPALDGPDPPQSGKDQAKYDLSLVGDKSEAIAQKKVQEERLARQNCEPLEFNNISMNSVEAYISCYDQVIKDYEKDPNNATAWNNKGCALVLQAKADALIYSGYYLPEGISPGKHALWRDKKIEEALECFDKAIQLNSSLAPAWYHKGLMLLEMRSEDSSRDY